MSPKKNVAAEPTKYRFVNSIHLPTLRAEGRGDELIFSSEKERAVVSINDEGIVSVLHRDLTNGKETRINTAQAHHLVVGSDNWTRDVYHFLKPNPAQHLQLRLGYTVHRGLGTWSSLPHDFENHPESGFEEAFFYLTKGGSGRGIQVGRGQWPDGSTVDAVWPFEHRTFSVIPMGYHPVVAEPGCQVRYVWAYLAKKKSWEKI